MEYNTIDISDLTINMSVIRTNPWLARSNIKTLSDQNIINDITKLSNFELTKSFGQLYVMTLSDDFDFNFDDAVSKCLINKEDYLKIKNKLIVKQIPFSVCKNDVIKNFLTLVNVDDLPEYYIDLHGKKQQFEDKILALSMLQISTNGLNCFLKQFTGITSISDIVQMLIVNDFLQKEQFGEQNKLTRRQLINNMNESNYWALNFNCKLNITLKFLNRGFNLALTQRLDDNEIKQIIERISSKAEEDNDYLSFIFKKQSFVDAAANIEKKGYQIYKISKNSSDELITIDEFNNILDLCLNKKELYLLLTNILISKEYCHLVINNPHVLDVLKDKNLYNDDKNDYEKRSLLQKYTPLFCYLWSYAWLTLYVEESIKKTRITNKDRFVFNLKSASELPYFPTLVNNPHSSPYLPMLIANEALSPADNNLGVPNYYINNKLSNGVVTDKEFKQRMNTFITGKENLDYFEDMNWSNVAVSGSIMAACLPKLNPLMLNFINSNDQINYHNYFNEYYKEADIDVMCNCSQFDYIKKVHDFTNTIEANIRKHNKVPDDQLFVVKITPVKTAAIIVNQEFVRRYILPTTKLSYVDIVLRCHDIEIKELFYPWYIKQKMQDNMKYINTPEFSNNMYTSYFDICKIQDLLIVITKNKDKDAVNTTPIVKPNVATNLNDNSILLESIEEYGIIPDEDIEYDDQKDDEVFEQVKDDECEFIANENLKFKISSNYLLHSFEMFRIKYEEFFSTVARFHLPIVRAYYDGSETYLLPSCISACMTMMNIDYKYFAGSKDPIEIINKYRMRGYGTYLNSKEKIRMIEYSNLVEKWKKLYNINIKNNNSVNSFFGYLNINHDLFKPSLNLRNENTKYNNSLYHSKQITESNIDQIYSDMYGGDYNTIDGTQRQIYKNNCICENGYIIPFRKWLIEACYEQPIKAYNP